MKFRNGMFVDFCKRGTMGVSQVVPGNDDFSWEKSTSMFVIIYEIFFIGKVCSGKTCCDTILLHYFRGKLNENIPLRFCIFFSAPPEQKVGSRYQNFISNIWKENHWYSIFSQYRIIHYFITFSYTLYPLYFTIHIRSVIRIHWKFNTRKFALRNRNCNQLPESDIEGQETAITTSTE